MTEKQFNRFSYRPFAKRMIEKRRKKTKNEFHHHKIKLQLYGSRIKHLTYGYIFE